MALKLDSATSSEAARILHLGMSRVVLSAVSQNHHPFQPQFASLRCYHLYKIITDARNTYCNTAKYNSSDIAYNYTTEHWYCCGDDCSNPAGTDPYYAPPPEYLYASASVGSSQMFYPIQAPVTAAHAVTYTSLTYDPTTSATSPSTVTIISDSTTQFTVTITQQSTPASVLRNSASILRTPAGVWAGLGLTTGIALVAMLVLVLFMSRYRRVAKELKLSKERLNTAWHDKGMKFTHSSPAEVGGLREQR